jgi:hypothetical protein
MSARPPPRRNAGCGRLRDTIQHNNAIQGCQRENKIKQKLYAWLVLHTERWRQELLALRVPGMGRQHVPTTDDDSRGASSYYYYSAVCHLTWVGCACLPTPALVYSGTTTAARRC